MRTVLPLAFAALATLVGAAWRGATSAAAPPADTGWEPVVAWQGDRPVLRVATGRPDAAAAGRQVVGVDDAGRVVHVSFQGSRPTATVLHRHGARLTGLAVADVDPAVAGEEIYVGGFLAPGGEGGKDGQGGAVLQVVAAPGGARVREVWRAGEGRFVHALAAVAARPGGPPARLLVADYAGIVEVLSPVEGKGPWTAVRLHEEPESVAPEDRAVKELQVLAPTPAGAVRALALTAGGRVVRIDVDVPGSGTLVHEEAGGLSRACDDGAGGAYVCGYEGRVTHLAADGDSLRAEVLWTDPVRGLRGVARGRFPRREGPPGFLAVYGYSEVCRVLAREDGVTSTDVFRDTANGHGLVADDLVAGNDGDELVLASYSNRILVLVPRGGS